MQPLRLRVSIKTSPPLQATSGVTTKARIEFRRPPLVSDNMFVITVIKKYCPRSSRLRPESETTIGLLGTFYAAETLLPAALLARPLFRPPRMSTRTMAENPS